MKNYLTNLRSTMSYASTKSFALRIFFSLLTLTVLSTGIQTVSAQSGQKKGREAHFIPPIRKSTQGGVKTTRHSLGELYSPNVGKYAPIVDR